MLFSGIACLTRPADQFRLLITLTHEAAVPDLSNNLQNP